MNMADNASKPSDFETAPLAQTAADPPDDARRFNQGLTPLHPPQKSLIRVQMIIRAVLLIIAGIGLEIALNTQLPLPRGTLAVPALVLALLIIIMLPNRIYRRWGYDMGGQGERGTPEQLRILRGFLWRVDTIVPFNRIQHIDVAQGPLQRYFGLSTLIVHTAGTHNSIVTLPGLKTADAEDMRDTIKAEIRQDMI